MIIIISVHDGLLHPQHCCHTAKMLLGHRPTLHKANNTAGCVSDTNAPVCFEVIWCFAVGVVSGR
jgi:hypothetical protein